VTIAAAGDFRQMRYAGSDGSGMAVYNKIRDKTQSVNG
jgi:hypothetical protein